MPAQPDILKQYDILITGAGPAGCACALALANSGLSVAIADKAIFPRDKVCGDAIPGRAIKTLRAIDSTFAEQFAAFADKYDTRKTALFYNNRSLAFNWVQEAYTSLRLAFDNFLFRLVCENTRTQVFTNTAVDDITTDANGIVATIKDTGNNLQAKLLIAADGAHSLAAKQLTGRTLDRGHHIGSVRGYFSNVLDTQPDTTEIYFDKRYLPGYLWLFPVPGNRANIGFGMVSEEIAKRKLNLRTAFYEFADRIPTLKSKLKDAQQVSPLEGFGLPLGSRIGQISGAHFMLVGDAASLIDPVSGDGIGNGMLSGKLAAEQAVRCFEQNNFTADHMKLYDRAIHATLGGELQARYRTQRLLTSMPFLLDAVFLAGRNKLLRNVMQKAL